ncbi:sugar phosphate isomerase/epimerase family protein [Cohnella sp. 56]|uniref:sugar phosphate isomerase/epimerase family protein n=1 Tax=Cohnella sp. 56 TaxID=3113722 RepID=UPI0030E809E2
MMKLGFLSAIVPDLSFEEVINYAAEQGFRSVELACWPVGKAERRYAGVTHIDVSALTVEKISYIRQYVEDRGIEISALGYYPNPLDEDLEQRKVYISHLEKVIEGASALGIGIVNTFIGRMQSKTLQENLLEYEKVWTPIVRLAEEKQVRIGIENCPMYFSMDEWPSGKNAAVSPAVWEEMFRIIPSSHLGLNYDPSHLVWQQMDYIKPIYEFKDRIIHIHIKDAKLYRDKLDRVGILASPLEYHSPKLPGLGDIDWGKFISALTDIRYDGHAIIEVEDKAYEATLESRQYALCQSRDYVLPFIGGR